MPRSDPGLCFAGSRHAVSRLEFLSDRTWVDARGDRHSSQQIFDAMFETIRRARKLVLLDMFLVNDFQRGRTETTRLLSSELTDVLVEHKESYPEIRIVFITDPINTVYGSLPSAQFARMAEAGISVVVTDLSRLRDSNPVYSLFWRYLVKPFGNSPGGLLPNPFDSRTRATLRSYLALLNYKANHRKVMVADDGADLAAIVSSANAQDASSAHTNVAIRFAGPAALDILAAENAVLALSGATPLESPVIPRGGMAGTSVRVLTEQAIKREAMRALNEAGAGEHIGLAMYYLSDHEVIDALRNARQRGAGVRVLLDPNKDAFGHRRYGIPNRPVAALLRQADIEVRWGDTHGEQCHLKMLLADYDNDESILLLGSANMTRRNLDNFNLETSVLVRASVASAIMVDARGFFELLWNNSEEQTFSVPYDRYRNESRLARYLYRFQEWSGWSTF